MVALGLFEQRLITERRLVTINHGKSLVVRPSYLEMRWLKWSIIVHQPNGGSKTVLLAAGGLTASAADTPGQIHQHPTVGFIALKIMRRTIAAGLQGDGGGNCASHCLEQRSSGTSGAPSGLIFH
jgi:hypothetical protein